MEPGHVSNCATGWTKDEFASIFFDPNVSDFEEDGDDDLQAQVDDILHGGKTSNRTYVMRYYYSKVLFNKKPITYLF